MTRRYGPGDLRRLSTRGSYSASHSSDIRSKSASAQSGSIKRSVFGSGEARE